MEKPTYNEIAKMLMELTVMADNSIPSDDLSNSQLMAAETVISQSWEMLNRIKETESLS